MQMDCKNSSKEMDNKSASQSNILLQIKPSLSAHYPSVLVTGDTPVTRIAKIDNIDSESQSVFMVPYQGSKEYLSLLPEDTRKQLSLPGSLRSAALHLALYHRRETFSASVDELKESKLKENGKSFVHYYLHTCNPEVDLAMMLQSPEAKVSSIFQSENFQLNWYRENKQKVFSQLVKAVTEEEGKQLRRITFLRDSLAWAHFYKHIRAEVYVMSARDLKEELRLEILNGIIIANVWRGTRCCIVITDSLPCSLGEVIQRDVRKFAFPEDGNSAEPNCRIGFLDKNSPSSARSVPFFTINPWSQTQKHVSNYHTISVNTVSHLVSGLGQEPRMNLIKDELDIKALISTRVSNMLISNISHSQRPSLNSGAHSNDLKPLETYLKLIGYKVTYASYDLDYVLDCLIGPMMVDQLRNITSKDIPELMGIIPILLKQKTVGNSWFKLTPTETSASEAVIDVFISRKSPLLFGNNTIKSATFHVKKARTMSVEITLKVNTSSPFKVSKYLEPRGSCGTTVADYVYGICCKEDAWLPAKKHLTVGEVLHVFLHEERAFAALQSLPLFLSFPLSKCKINHYLTTILVDSTRSLQEAHIYVCTPFQLSPIFINHTKFCIRIESLAMHLFPLCDIDKHMIQIDGNCSVDGIQMKFTCCSSPDSQKHVRFFFANALPAKEVFKLFGISVPPASLSHPTCNSSLENTLTYEGGFVLSQLFGSTIESSLTSLFFGVELCSFDQMLPPELNRIQNAKICTTVHFPTGTPKVGFEVSFTSKIKVSGSPETELECCLSVSPSLTNSSYTYEVTVRPNGNPYKPQELKGMSVYAIASALSSTLGRSLEEEVRKIPKLGDQILNNVSLRKIVFQLLDREVQALELHVTISDLEIIPGKLSVNDCSLHISYSKEGLVLECSGNLIFLQRFTYSVHFSLPTAEKKGVVSFKNHSSDLILREILQEFGWLSCDVKSNPILAGALDITVRKIAVEFDGRLQITAAELGIFKEELDLGLVTLQGIELDVSTKLVNGHYVTAFSLGAYISDALHAQLEYNPDRHILTGKVIVTFSKSLPATDALQTFRSSISSYDNMKCILKEDFMDVFKSDLNIVTQPGLTASLNVSIGLPQKHSRQYSLEFLNLEVGDALKIADSYVLNMFQFQYLNQPDSKDVVSTSHLSLAVHKLNSKENMSLEFDFTSRQDKTSVLTAKVQAGPQGGFLKLSSAIDLAQAVVPELPKYDVGLPRIFDMELLSGSISFELRPVFRPSAFDISILIEKWQVFENPELTVHKLTLKTTWESGNFPQLSFADCSLTFLEHELFLTGKLTSKEVYIECKSAKKLPEANPVQLQSILDDYTPNSQPHPNLPTDIGLPPMEVELRNLVILLQEEKRTFCVNTRVIAHSPWMIDFGSHTILVRELGGALEWEKLKKKTLYKAFLYGTIELLGMQVKMEMLLGKNIDSIISATVSRPQYLQYGQIADHFLYSEAITPYDQYNPGNSGLSELVPSSMQDLSLTSASTALNVTKRQFFLSSEVEKWGRGSLLIGYLLDEKEMDYVISLSLDKGLAFGRLSESLAFVDELLTLNSVIVLISSATLSNLSDVMSKFSHSFSQSQVREKLQKPFYESKLLGSTRLAEQKVRAGTTIYAEIDITQSRGGINKLMELGDSSVESDISIMTYIGKSTTNTDLEIQAWIPRICLFQMLEFSNIHLIYRVQTASEFELTGTVALYLNVNSSNEPQLKFFGKLSVNPTFAKFSTCSCRNIVSRPVGISITVKDLALGLKMYLNGESPDVHISGRLAIGSVALTCTFILKGITFKVFQIRLESGLMLSALFSCSNVDWSVELDIGIKEGQFYYASSDAIFEDDDGNVCPYKAGYHLDAIITLFESDFRITADIPHDRSDITLSGRSIGQIDFGFAKITGARPYTDEGPELKYSGSEKSLALILGVEIFKHPCFEGELKYKFKEKALEGTIRYPGRFLWINEPSMTVRWSKDGGFDIVNFSLCGDVPGFSLLGAIAKFAKIIYNLVTGILRWGIKLHLKTGKNPNPRKHLLKLILTGELVITVIGFDIPIIPLPEVPILLPRMDDFSFAKLPQYILRCLWDSAGAICVSLLKYLNPWTLLKQSLGMIWNGVKGACKTVWNVTKKIGQGIADGAKKVWQGTKTVATKVWRGITSWFGRSAFIVDMDNGMVLGYIRGGKGGRKLHNEQYIVEQFGPILAVNAIGAMAHDVHKHYKSCVDAQDEERSKSSEEVDSNERTLDEQTKVGLDQLKGNAEELAASLNIVSDKVLTVKEVSIKVDDVGENISIEWAVYNPEEGVFYTEDNGDIEYHVKVIATVIEGEDVKTISIYDDIFMYEQKEDEDVGSPKEEGAEEVESTKVSQPQIAEAIDGIMQHLADDMVQSKEEEKSPNGQNTAEMSLVAETTQRVQAVAEEDQKCHDAEQNLQSDRNTAETAEMSLSQTVAETSQKAKVQVVVEDEELDDQDCQEGRKDDELQHLEHNDSEVSDSQEDKGNSEGDPQLDQNQCTIKNHISLHVPFDSSTLGRTVCICASIQPKVTLEVKMLPPDKIATGEYFVDKNLLDEGDTLWMDNTKTEIEKNGRINEVTLEGKKVCELQLIKLDSESKVQFTAQCNHEEDSLTIFGNITPVPEAECYLVRLVDRNELTVIIKELRLLPHELHYKFGAFPSDFPDTSSGPYHVSVIALRTDLSTCSAFTYSEMEILRYDSPVCLTQTLPNLDSSKSDIVRLEWRHPRSSGHDSSKDISSVDVPSAPDSQEGAGASEDVPVDGVSSDPHEEGDTMLTQSAYLDPQKENVTSTNVLAGQQEAAYDTVSKTDEPAGSQSHVHNQMLSEKAGHSYVITITGVCIKKPSDSTARGTTISVDNVDNSEVAFKMPVVVHMDQDSSEPVGYDFSLASVLEKNKLEIQGGLLFQCQIVTTGASRFRSMPKSFADFILLAPPMELQATTPVRRAGLHIQWAYSAHAIGYRIELFNQHTMETVFSRMEKCETGSHGKAVLHKSDFKDIPYTSSGSGYQLQMYSLGFGQELIRCLSPSVAAGTFHVIPAELQYLENLNIVRVKFRPFIDMRAEYIVQLCHVQGDNIDFHLTARHIYDHEVRNETVRDFPLKKWRHLFQSGDIITAWVRSTATEDTGISYIGVPQEEVCVMDSPKLAASPSYRSDGTVSGIKLSWSKVRKAQRYQYGYYMSDKYDYIILKETQEREAVISHNSSLLEQISSNSCQFQLYATALGKPGVLVAGEVSLHPLLFQCIKSHGLLEERGAVIFTSFSLQQMWKSHLNDYTLSHYYPRVPKPQHILFPSKEPFPSLSIPPNYLEKFWESESPLLGSGKSQCYSA